MQKTNIFSDSIFKEFYLRMFEKGITRYTFM